MKVERGAPPSRPPAGPPPGSSGPRRLAPTPPDQPGRSAAGSRVGADRAPAGAALSGVTPSSRGPRRLAGPRAVRVSADPSGRPLTVAGRDVDGVRESWLVEDRWWTDAPLRRRYWEIVTADGRDLVVFRDLEGGKWYTQR